MQKGSIVRLDSLPHDGVWLGDRQVFRYSVRLLRLLNARGEQIITWSDYHKFQVDSRIVEAGAK
jgi:hypothetical protein